MKLISEFEFIEAQLLKSSIELFFCPLSRSLGMRMAPAKDRIQIDGQPITWPTIYTPRPIYESSARYIFNLQPEVIVAVKYIRNRLGCRHKPSPQLLSHMHTGTADYSIRRAHMDDQYTQRRHTHSRATPCTLYCS